MLRVQRWLAPTCPWVTGGRRGLCLASREEAAASPGLQALETHIRESHFVKSVFFTPHYHLEERAWCCWQMAIYIRGRRSDVWWQISLFHSFLEYIPTFKLKFIQTLAYNSNTNLQNPNPKPSTRIWIWVLRFGMYWFKLLFWEGTAKKNRIYSLRRGPVNKNVSNAWFQELLV